MMSSMADSLLPMPESPVIITPSPEMSSSTPWRVTQGASTRFRYSMVWLVNSTVVSSVRSSVRSWTRALSRHSGKQSSPREITRAGMS